MGSLLNLTWSTLFWTLVTFSWVNVRWLYGTRESEASCQTLNKMAKSNAWWMACMPTSYSKGGLVYKHKNDTALQTYNFCSHNFYEVCAANPFLRGIWAVWRQVHLHRIRSMEPFAQHHQRSMCGIVQYLGKHTKTIHFKKRKITSKF